MNGARVRIDGEGTMVGKHAIWKLGGMCVSTFVDSLENKH